MNAALIARLEAQKATVVAAVVADMYEDPFWNERFAARGRKHSEQDLAFHADYVVQALAGDDTAVMERYAKWLQSILTTRGMCTLHLADSFGRLAGVVNEPAVTALMTAARTALLYPDGSARALQERIRDAIVSGAPGSIEDTAYHLAYLADALALGGPRVFVEHEKWLAGFIQRQGRDPHALVATLEAMSRTLDGDQAKSMVAAALKELA